MKLKNRSRRWLVPTAAFALALTLGVLLTAPAAATCTGSRIDYYSTPALLEIVGTKVQCPGYPDQIDEPYYQETPWYTIQSVNCPCPPQGGGGGNGGGNDQDEEEPGG